MSFKLGDIIVKEILYAVGMNNENVPLYVLTQLSDASIAITAESTDVTDKNGNIVKRIYTSKSGEFSATNAFLNANILAQAGADTIFAEDAAGGVIVPQMIQAKASEKTVDLKTTNVDDIASVTVNMLYGDGSLGKAYTVTTDFTVDSDGILTLPTDSEASLYFITYNKTFSKDAVVITNTADKFPDSVRMLMKVSYYNPCDKTEIKAAFVDMPSFQVSPETTVSLSASEPTMDFSGTLELDYCGEDKVLYNIYLYDEED